MPFLMPPRNPIQKDFPMKKFAILAVSALVFGGVLVTASPALAFPPTPVAPVFTLDTGSTIENGGAVAGTWDQGIVPAGFCVVGTYASGIVFLVNPTDSLNPISIPEGDFSVFNANLTSAPVMYSLDVYSVSVDCSSPRTLVTSTAWTVNPRLSVATPADFIVGTPAEQTVATILHDFTSGGILNLTDGAHWEVVPGALCEDALQPGGVAAPKYVALPVGISVNLAGSAAGTVPLLTFTGTATPEEVGSYQLCLNLVSNALPLINDFQTTSAFASTTLTIVPAPVVVPALANTGFDTSGFVAGGVGVLGLGVLLIGLRRRRRATV
jgi:LPXTG-motif cell wall-anchored protein